jgi:hypothetical protein
VTPDFATKPDVVEGLSIMRPNWPRMIVEGFQKGKNMKLSPVFCASVVALAALALTVDGAIAATPYSSSKSNTSGQKTSSTTNAGAHNSALKPKNCKCVGNDHDGPLKGLCVIACRCPGNCGN